MAAGTLTLTNNSDAVAGAGTAFTTELTPGDFIVANVGGIAYTLPVKSVTSDTAMTLSSKFTGPTMNGLAWFVVTRDQQASITAALVAQSTEALRGLNYDKQNWQAVFSSAGDITVTLPDGTQFTGPSWRNILDTTRKMIDACFPVGIRLDWPSLTLPDNPALGVKFLRLNGANFDPELYPKLSSVYPSGKLPDMRANVPRGYDDGRGIDQGRDLLSEQQSAAPDITGEFQSVIPDGAQGSFVKLSQNATTVASPGGVATGRVGFSAASSSPIYSSVNEIRMRNMAWNMIVRAS